MKTLLFISFLANTCCMGMPISAVPVKKLTVNMPAKKFFKIYPKQKARTYRIQNTEQWLTYDSLIEGRHDLLTFHTHDDKLVGWTVNDRVEIVEEYLSEFCSGGIKGHDKIYQAVKNALTKIPHDAFLIVTDRARPMMFTEYYDTGMGRLANTSEILVLPDDPPTFAQGMGIIKLSTELNGASEAAEIEGIILHELAHRVLDHARQPIGVCDRERQANRLVKSWGYTEEFEKAKARFGRKEGEPDVECE